MELNSICRLCKRNVKEKENSIACDLCDCWQHIKCLKIPLDVHTFISKQRGGSKFGIFQWICSSCQPVLDIVTQCTRDVEAEAVEAVNVLWKWKHFDERGWKRKRTRK